MKYLPMVWAAVIALHCQPVMAEGHALIMGISEYPQSPLPGVATDLQTARSIAAAFGIPERNFVVRKNGQLTLSGLRNSLDEFAKKVRPGDLAFVYFSGHGTSYSKTRSGGQCERALVTAGMDRFDRNEFQSYVDKITRKAAKTIVFLDTCFSGGIVKNSRRFQVSLNDNTPRIKFDSSSPDDRCAQASNYDSKSARDFSIETAKNTQNYFLLGSAAPDEYAIDGGRQIGGFATASLAGCLHAGKEADSDHDGLISIGEATRCAQRRVNRLVQKSREEGFPFLRQTLTSAGGPGGAIIVSYNENQPASHAGDDRKIDTAALLKTIYQGRDAHYNLQLTPAKKEFSIGEDFLELSITSDREGYLTLFSVGSSGKIFRLFPNAVDKNNLISAGETMMLPRNEWRISARGPAGEDRFLAVVASDRQRFDGLGLPEGPFAKLEADPETAKQFIQRLRADRNRCAATRGERDFSIETDPCTGSYAAAIASVREVNP